MTHALLSVYDKQKLADFAKGLNQLGIQIISSGGTSQELAAENIPVTEVSELTGVSEAFDGRVKTLHPIIHAGILAKPDDPDHLKQLKELGAFPIGLVVCSLYPFEREPSIEMIDIGGPAMIRAAAKNYEYVGVVVDPNDYEEVLAELQASNKANPEAVAGLSLATRKQLAQKAFDLTTRYDSQIADWLGAGDSDSPTPSLPSRLNIGLSKSQDLRYGENPHQTGALYTLADASSFFEELEILHGKPLSYLNIYDTAAGWQLAHNLVEDTTPAAVIIKHANPCGAALDADITTAVGHALNCDPVSAFGGVVAVTLPVTAELAEAINELFIEVLIAPDYEPAALETLQKKKNIRLLKAPAPAALQLHIRSVENAFLVQTPDEVETDPQKWQVVTQKQPTQKELVDLVFAQKVVAATTSNAIVIAKDQMALGIGAGQQNRKDAGAIAAKKADGRAVGGVYASDAFLPFADGLDGALEAGCSAVVQPGGSVRDDEVIAAAEANGLSMVFTGLRRFRH